MDWQTLPFAVDLSHHNGVVDWDRLAAQRPACVFLKATERQWTDPAFERNRQAAAARGLLWVPYVFLRPDDDEGAMRHLRDLVADPTVPVALDWESGGVASAVVEDWIAALEADGGRTPLAYYGLFPPATASEAIARCPRWFPQYPGSATAASRLPMWDGVGVPDWRKCWLVWQWSQKGAVAGVAGSVDLNRLAISAERFAAWYRGAELDDPAAGAGDVVRPPVIFAAGEADDPGEHIKAAQRVLLAAGLLKRPDGSPGLVDGDPGDMTRQALKAWRALHPA